MKHDPIKLGNFVHSLKKTLQFLMCSSLKYEPTCLRKPCWSCTMKRHMQLKAQMLCSELRLWWCHRMQREASTAVNTSNSLCFDFEGSLASECSETSNCCRWLCDLSHDLPHHLTCGAHTQIKSPGDSISLLHFYSEFTTHYCLFSFVSVTLSCIKENICLFLSIICPC